MPALTEARAKRPDARFSWVVEEAFAPLVRLHPAVDEVIPVAVRRWRQTPLQPSTWRQWRRSPDAARAELRRNCRHSGPAEVGADCALRAGRRHGYDRDSIKEPAASWFTISSIRSDGASTRLRATAR